MTDRDNGSQSQWPGQPLEGDMKMKTNKAKKTRTEFQLQLRQLLQSTIGY